MDFIELQHIDYTNDLMFKGYVADALKGFCGIKGSSILNSFISYKNIEIEKSDEIKKNIKEMINGKE